jgi:hypothetical protein
MNAPVEAGIRGYARKQFRKRLRGSIRRYRRSGDYDLANAAQELLTALKAGYPCPSYRGLGDDGACLQLRTRIPGLVREYVPRMKGGAQ